MENVAVFLASLTLMVGWWQYRKNVHDERKRILISLRSLLNVTKHWISTGYAEGVKKPAWFDPGISVYKINFSVISGFLNSNLLPERFSKLLTYFIQLTERFNQRIEICIGYTYSDLDLFFQASDFARDHLRNQNLSNKPFLSYEECFTKVEGLKKTNKQLYDYLSKLYRLQEIIHTDGIGDNSYYEETFPKLHKCYLELDCALKAEEAQTRGLLKNDPAYLLGDVFLILVPLSAMIWSVYSFFVSSSDIYLISIF